MTDLTPEKIQEIVDGCKGVTPGPWKWRPDGQSDERFLFLGAQNGHTVLGVDGIGEDCWIESCNEKNIFHIARLDPDTVKELCKLALESKEAFEKGRNEGLEEAAKSLDAAAKEYGVYHDWILLVHILGREAVRFRDLIKQGEGQ